MLWSDETAFDSAMKWWDCIWQCYRVTAIWEMLESTRKHHRHTMHTMAYYGFGDGTMTCCGKNLSLLMNSVRESFLLNNNFVDHILLNLERGAHILDWRLNDIQYKYPLLEPLAWSTVYVPQISLENLKKYSYKGIGKSVSTVDQDILILFLHL